MKISTSSMLNHITIALFLLTQLSFNAISSEERYQPRKKLSWASFTNGGQGEKNFDLHSSTSDWYTRRSRPGVPVRRRATTTNVKLPHALPVALHLAKSNSNDKETEPKFIEKKSLKLKLSEPKQLIPRPVESNTVDKIQNVPNIVSNKNKNIQGDILPNAVPSNQLQKRALDLIYHKFVEPRIHSSIEPRPSLIEELIQTFESHVIKDLKAWRTSNVIQSLGKGSSKNVVSKEEPVNSTTDIINNISSVAQVEKGEDQDTFIVTDDSGSTHVISVDEIINSLALMNEAEISDLLLGTPIEPIDRSSTGNFDISSIPFSNSIVNGVKRSVNPIPENRASYSIVKGQLVTSLKSSNENNEETFKINQNKNSDVSLKRVQNKNNDSFKKVQNNNVNYNILSAPTNPPRVQPDASHQLILVRGEDGDMRLVTQKDLAYSKIATVKKVKKKRTPTIQSNTVKIPPSSVSSNKNIASPKPIKKKEKENSPVNFAALLQQYQHNANPIKNTQPINTLDELRLGQALYEAKRKKQQNLDLTSLTRPTQPQHRNPPVRSQKPTPNIGGPLASFFSSLLGQNNQQQQENFDINRQYSKVLVPKRVSGGGVKDIIRLPQSIHFDSRPTRSTLVPAKRSSLQTLSRLFNIGTQNIQERKSSQVQNRNGPVNRDLNTANSVLKSANIPDSVIQRLLAQMGDKPTFVIPGTSQTMDSIGAEQRQDDGQIDRLALFTKIKKPKTKRLPSGYEYVLPPAEYLEYGQPQSYSHETYGPYVQSYAAEDQPLIDINLLSNVVYLSKLGDDNESFSFPKVGDASKFVDIHHRHY